MAPSQTCFDYSVGKCDRGDTCKFDHADEHVPSRRSDRGDRGGGRRDGPSTNRGGSDRCYDFTQNKCDRGASCKFLHPETCFDFSVGKCDRGDNCRFFHSETHYPPSQRGGSFQTTHSGYGPDRRGSSRGRGGAQTYRNPHPSRSRNPSPPMRAQRGARGTSFRNPPPMRAQRGGAPSDDVCFDFTVGKCNRGDNCKFVHPETCYDFSVDKCTRGDRCKFLHPGPDNRGKKHQQPPRRCYDHTQGKCTRGETCKFTHEEPADDQGNAQDNDGDDGLALLDIVDNPDIQNEPQGETCYDFSVGKCNRGDQCRFIHDAERKHVPSSKRAAPY